eukprot:scaffold149_cov315-Pinguiococcus_pyrenoidosus.AAC.30
MGRRLVREAVQKMAAVAGGSAALVRLLSGGLERHDDAALALLAKSEEHRHGAATGGVEIREATEGSQYGGGRVVLGAQNHHGRGSIRDGPMTVALAKLLQLRESRPKLRATHPPSGGVKDFLPYASRRCNPYAAEEWSKADAAKKGEKKREKIGPGW